MGGKRVTKDGDVTHVISPTLSDDTYKAVKRVALKYDSSIGAVVRTAIIMGVQQMDKQYDKREAGEANVCEAIIRSLGVDRRKRTRVKE
jgi:predicted transcriptional regulator